MKVTGLLVQVCSREPAGEVTSDAITSPDKVTTAAEGLRPAAQVAVIVMVLPLEWKGSAAGAVMIGVGGTEVSRIH